MSEVTTGAVPLALIGAPLPVGAACIGAVYFAGKYCAKQYEKMLDEIEKADQRLKWLDNQQISSPLQMLEEAKRLQKIVSNNDIFCQMTKDVSYVQREIIAGAIATQHSPLKAYVPSLLDQLPESESSFENALKQGTRNLALDNFRYVNNVVKEAAAANGFIGEVKVLKATPSVLDIVFSDRENPTKKFTAYCKIDKQMNPSLALDLEGFACDSNDCTLKMQEIVRYLQGHGVPFNFARIKHNQPMGVLRKLVDKKNASKQNAEIAEYLKGDSNKSNNYLKQK